MHTLLRRLSSVALVAVASLAVAGVASAQTASDLYARAQKRGAAATASPTLASLRAASGSYESIVRRYPRSGFCDDALWNAAAAARMAWERFQQPADLATATRLLKWLRREYPRSSWSSQAAVHLTALSQPAKPAATRPAPGVPALAIAATPLATALPPSASATIRSITRSELPRGERLTIELDREVIVAPERIANPERVFFDLRNTHFDHSIATALEGVTGPRIASVRIGRQDAQTTRIVLALAGAPRHSVFTLYHPYRLVVDLEADALTPLTVSTDSGGPEIVTVPPVVTHRAIDPRPIPSIPTAPVAVTVPEKTGVPLGLPPAPPAATSRGDYSLARQLGLGISRIVIDAGHGGHDPGAQANGVVEADLVLDIAQRVEKLLKKQPGIDVVLTRRDDTFIPLEERTAIANREGADLFLSIHANASRREAAQGVETYFLNFATNADAEAVAARENSGSQTSMGKLPAIVQQIALHNKMRESRELAQIVQSNMVRGMRAQNKGVVDLGVKQAPFVVLIGAQMPSVLAELSFVTNKPEASLLKKEAYRQRIAQSLADAVIKYQTSLKKVTTTAVAGGR